MTDRAHLKTHGHEDIGLTLLWLVWLDTWIHQLHELIKDSLRCVVNHNPLDAGNNDRCLTFCTRFFLLTSFELSEELLSRDDLTLALTFCRRVATSLTFTSDSSSAAVISFNVASNTCEQIMVRSDHPSIQTNTSLLIDHRCPVEGREGIVESATEIGEHHVDAVGTPRQT